MSWMKGMGLIGCRNWGASRRGNGEVGENRLRGKEEILYGRTTRQIVRVPTVKCDENVQMKSKENEADICKSLRG